MDLKKGEAIVSVLDSFLRAIEGVMEQFRTLAIVTAKDTEVSEHNRMFQEQCTLAFRDVMALIGALRRDYISLAGDNKSSVVTGDIDPPSPVVESLRMAADPPLYPDVFEAISLHDIGGLNLQPLLHEETVPVIPTPPKNPPRQAPRPSTEAVTPAVRRLTSDSGPFPSNRCVRSIAERVDELSSLLYLEHSTVDKAS